MKRAIYSIPLLGVSLVGCGEAERSDDPIVAKYNATVFEGDAVPVTVTYTDEYTNVTCTLGISVAMEVNDSLKALIAISYSQECDDGSNTGAYTGAYLADVEVVEAGAKYLITFGPADFLTTLDCTLDAAGLLQCLDDNQSEWAFQVVN